MATAIDSIGLGSVRMEILENEFSGDNPGKRRCLVARN